MQLAIMQCNWDCSFASITMIQSIQPKQNVGWWAVVDRLSTILTTVFSKGTQIARRCSRPTLPVRALVPVRLADQETCDTPRVATVVYRHRRHERRSHQSRRRSRYQVDGGIGNLESLQVFIALWLRILTICSFFPVLKVQDRPSSACSRTVPTGACLGSECGAPPSLHFIRWDGDTLRWAI